MGDRFLEEQVRRIKQLTERMAQVTRRPDLEDAVARDRDISRHDPLHEVRDVRIVNSVPDRRASAHDGSPRRRRRR